MNQDEAAEILSGLRRELTTARQSLVAAQRRISALRKTMEGLTELFPGLADRQPQLITVAVDDEPGDEEPGDEGESSDRADYPRGQEAVGTILAAPEFRGRYWTIAQVADELSQRGWPPRSRSGEPLSEAQAANAVRSSLARLVESDPHVKRGAGEHGNIVYYYQHDGMPPAKFRSPRETSEERDAAHPRRVIRRRRDLIEANGANRTRSLASEPSRFGDREEG